MTAAPEDGHALAARWQIERTRRPAAPELVWMSYTRPEIARFACLACGDAEPKQAVLRAFGHTLYLCPACASHQAHPPASPEAQPDGFARRLAVEHDADLLQAADRAARGLAGRAGGTLLDLGCGLGFTVDIVRHLPGWTATGVDPGPLAVLGRTALGAELRQGGPPQAAAGSQAPAQVVLAEFVLERSPDPLGLLRALPALSAPRANWLIATADAAALYSLADPWAILHRLRHKPTLLPSAPGLAALLRRAGDVTLFTAPVTQTSEGTLRVGLPLPPHADADPAPLLERYFAARLATPLPDAGFDLALRLAALAHAVARGHGPDARIILAALDRPLRAATEAAEGRAAHASLTTLFAEAPLCAGRLLLLAGLAARLDPADGALARFYLEQAEGMCRRAHALAPLGMRDDAELAERAAQALAEPAPARAAA